MPSCAAYYKAYMQSLKLNDPQAFFFFFFLKTLIFCVLCCHTGRLVLSPNSSIAFAFRRVELVTYDLIHTNVVFFFSVTLFMKEGHR